MASQKLRARAIVIGFCFSFLLVACSDRTTADSSQTKGTRSEVIEGKIAALNAAIPDLMKRASVPGLSIALVADGKVQWTGAYGVMSTESNAPIIPETTFEAASLSKPVFTLAFLNAVERGDMDLDTPISDNFTYDRFGPESVERVKLITPRLVLSHRTGLPNWDREGTLDFARDPGVQYGYSGEGFVYLQKALEAATGRNLNDLVGEYVFEPFGMNDSSYLWRDDYEMRLASGHDDEGNPQKRNHYTEENAAYSLVTTAADYGAFLGKVMDGAGLDDALFNDMFTVQTSMLGNETRTKHPPEIWSKIHWGLSWGIQDADDGPIYWHWGDNDTYRNLAAFSQNQDIGFVYFTNSQNGLKIANNIASIVLGDMGPTVIWLGYGIFDDEEKGQATALSE